MIQCHQGSRDPRFGNEKISYNYDVDHHFLSQFQVE
jgi:hypothetical protein